MCLEERRRLLREMGTIRNTFRFGGIVNGEKLIEILEIKRKYMTAITFFEKHFSINLDRKSYVYH